MGDGGSQGWSFPLSPSSSPSLTLFLAVVVLKGEEYIRGLHHDGTFSLFPPFACGV